MGVVATVTETRNSNVTQDRRRDGQVIAFTYDALNRMTFKDVPNTVTGEYDVTTTYDNLGHPINVTDTANNFVGAGFDALGRMTSQSSPNGTFTMTYDAAGRLTRITHPDSVFFTYSYNTSDLTGVQENGTTSLVSYSYDNLGRRTAITRGNGTVTSYNWDAAGRLGSYSQDLGGTAGDVTWGGATAGSLVSYNPANQLTVITRNNDSYAWTGHYNVNRAYGTNGLNQLTTAGATALGYDGRGNLTSSGSSAYSYTSENRLASGPGGVTLYYDPTGRMSRLVQGAATTKFEYLGPRLVIERDAAGNVLRRYIHGPGDDEPLVWYEGSGLTNKRWLHTDERGSVIAVTDGSGASIATNRYDEYGIPQSGNVGRFQYTGQAWVPELGLYYYKARMYSPTLGRFMQTDPIGYKDGISWYAYVGDDPVNRVDPSGLTSCAGKKGEECPDIPMPPKDVIDAQVKALKDSTTLRKGADEQAVTTYSDSEGKVTSVKTGKDAGKNNTPSSVDIIVNKGSKGSTLSSTGHSQPRDDPCSGCRNMDSRNRLPSRDDLTTTLQNTNTPLFVRGSDGTISVTTRQNGIDTITVLEPGSGGRIKELPKDISDDTVLVQP